MKRHTDPAAFLADLARKQHGDYNGWCRVVGIPLKSTACPECRLDKARRAYLDGDWDALEEALGFAPLPTGPTLAVDEIRKQPPDAD